MSTESSFPSPGQGPKEVRGSRPPWTGSPVPGPGRVTVEGQSRRHPLWSFTHPEKGQLHRPEVATGLRPLLGEVAEEHNRGELQELVEVNGDGVDACVKGRGHPCSPSSDDSPMTLSYPYLIHMWGFSPYPFPMSFHEELGRGIRSDFVTS